MCFCDYFSTEFNMYTKFGSNLAEYHLIESYASPPKHRKAVKCMSKMYYVSCDLTILGRQLIWVGGCHIVKIAVGGLLY